MMAFFQKIHIFLTLKIYASNSNGAVIQQN